MSVRVRGGGGGPTPLLWGAVRRMHLKKGGQRQRPETATLEKPLVLDPKLLRKVDMTRLTRERLLTIENLIGAQKQQQDEPRKDLDPGDRPRVINTTFRVRSRARKGLREVFPKEAEPGQKMKENRKALEEGGRRREVDDGGRRREVEEVFGTLVLENRVPSPCRSCGRSERPERLHAHPAVPQKKRSRMKEEEKPKEKEVPPPVPQKSAVTKPVAMKFRSGKARTRRPAVADGEKDGSKEDKPKGLVRRETFKVDRGAKSLSAENKGPSPSPPGKASVPAPAPKRPAPRLEKTPPLVAPTANPIVHSASPRRPRTTTCYLCQKQFGTASYPLHEPQCLQRWQRENPGQTPKECGAPEGPGAPGEPRRPSGAPPPEPAWDDAWQAAQANMVPCEGCGKKFLPHRLDAHHRVCRAPGVRRRRESAIPVPIPVPIQVPIAGPVPAVAVTAPVADELTAQSEDYDSELEPPSYHCHICGRVFDKEAVAGHERLCLRRWQMEHSRDSSLAADSAASGSPSASTSSSACSTPRRRRLVLCYLCGRQFGSASIAIHEPQCLRRWHQENDLLPADRRRAPPARPDPILDPVSGEVDVRATEEAQWKCHLVQLVPCGRCGRTFNPDRVAVHERCCKGPAPPAKQ